MAVKILKQNLEYFKYPNNIIKAGEIDNRFNEIVNYLNDEVIFKLNNVNDTIVVGSLIQDDINSILKSRSDIGYLWKKIDNNDFADKSINFNKFNYYNIINSIFVSDVNGDIKQINNPDMINNTIVKDNTGIKFSKITNKYIDPTSKITGDKIAFDSITEANLTNITPDVLDSTIINEHFNDGSITSSKIRNGSIVFDSFKPDVLDLLNNKIWMSIIPSGFINMDSNGNRNNIINGYWDRDFIKRIFYGSLPIGNSSLKSFVVSETKFNNFYVKNIIRYYDKIPRATDLSLIDPNGNLVGAEKRYLLSSNLFKPNSINASRLVCWFHKLNDGNAHNINDILANKSIDMVHLTLAIQGKLV